MQTIRCFKAACAAFVLGAAFAVPATASVVTLDFEGAGNQARLLNFYDGGTDGLGRRGPNDGIVFGSDALALVDVDQGGSGNFANEPSPDTVMFFLTGTAVLDAPAGFTGGFSFWYSSSTAATVNVYGGLDATGQLIGTIQLAAQYDHQCTGDPTGDFCHWTAAGVSFAGAAHSIDFGGTVNQVGYDNVTFGSAVPTAPVSEPGSGALAGLGLAGLAIAVRRRKPRA